MSTTTHHAETSGPHADAPDAPAQPLAAAPSCPTCGGRMWDNRLTKRNPKAPDFKCRDRRCDGVLWPGEHNVARPVVERGNAANRDAGAGEQAPETRAGNGAGSATPLRRSLRDCYLDVTDFVLGEVRPKYEAAGLPCTDATVAAIAATLFIGVCKTRDLRTQEGGR